MISFSLSCDMLARCLMVTWYFTLYSCMSINALSLVNALLQLVVYAVWSYLKYCLCSSEGKIDNHDLTVPWFDCCLVPLYTTRVACNNSLGGSHVLKSSLQRSQQHQHRKGILHSLVSESRLVGQSRTEGDVRPATPSVWPVLSSL